MPSEINKGNIDFYLKELAKAYRKENRHSAPVELIIVGGGAILLNYSFREATTDIDVFSTSQQAIEHAAQSVAEQYNLPDDWINSDFTSTSSFSYKLREVSVPYRTLNNGMFEIRTVGAEYLIAMKLKSFREYKNDISDVIGILFSEKEQGIDISMAQVKEAYYMLYKQEMSEKAESFLKEYMDLDASALHDAYLQVSGQEEKTRNALTSIDSKYPGTLSEQNVNAAVSAIENGKTVSAEDLMRIAKAGNKK